MHLALNVWLLYGVWGFLFYFFYSFVKEGELLLFSDPFNQFRNLTLFCDLKDTGNITVHYIITCDLFIVITVPVKTLRIIPFCGHYLHPFNCPLLSIALIPFNMASPRLVSCLS